MTTLFVFAFGMFFLFVLFMIFPIWLFSVVPHPGMHLEVISAEEFQAVLDKFHNNSEYIHAHANFPIDTRAYYHVYGDVAKGDVEMAIRIFNHPEYPKNVFHPVFIAYKALEDMRISDLEFKEMFDEEIADIRIGAYGDGIIVSVNSAYSSQENFVKYECKIREYLVHYDDYIPLTFEEKNMFDIRVPSGIEFFSSPEIMISLFILCTVIFVTYFVRINKI